MPKEILKNNSSPRLVLELIEVLNQEASLFETFLELLEQQQQALVQNDIAALNAVTARQHEKTVESRMLAKRREEIVLKLSSDGAIQEDLTISRLIEFVSSGQAAVLSQLRDSILDLNDKIMRVRSQNEMLISRSRDNIMKTMELLGHISAPDGRYQSGGKPSRMSTTIALDRRA